jgi:hypothetical protein
LVGVRFPIDGSFLPSLSLELLGSDAAETRHLIQNTPAEINAHIIGVCTTEKSGKDYPPGYYGLFSGRLSIYEKDIALDRIGHSGKTLSGDKNPGGLQNYRSLYQSIVGEPSWQLEGRWSARGFSLTAIKDRNKVFAFPFLLVRRFL